MLRYALGRLASALPTLFLVVVAAFFLTRAAPGGPFDKDRQLAPEIEARLQASYNLDESMPEQFGRYLSALVRGDLGPSFRYADYSVAEMIAAALPVSLTLGVLAMALALALGIPIGALAALRKGHWPDRVVMAISMIGISIPNFVVAPVLVLLFAVTLKWLPAGDMGTAKHFVLPVIALALPQIAYIARLTRGAMVDVLRANFIRTARAQGHSDWVVVVRHALKPTLIPVVSYLGPAIVMLLSGSVVVEQIFVLPGLGKLFVEAALNRDYTVVMGIVIFYGVLIIAFNLLVDLLYGCLDPRVRYT